MGARVTTLHLDPRQAALVVGLAQQSTLSLQMAVSVRCRILLPPANKGDDEDVRMQTLACLL